MGKIDLTSRDPFAAQQQQQAANLAAYYGYGQALPGTTEGVETVEKKKPTALYGAIAGGALLVFIVGSFWGGISNTRSEFNLTTDQAAKIRDEVDGLQKNLDKIITEFRKPAPGGVDLDQAARLDALGLKKPDYVKLFHTNYAHLESLAVDRLFTYYNDTIKLYDAISDHARKTAADKESIQKAIEKARGAGTKNYGFILDVSSAIPVAKFVEVGAPVCPKEGQTDCKADELKLKYRVDTGSPWSVLPVKGKPGETITPLKPTPLFDSVATGSVDALAAEAYGRRVRNIAELVGSLEKTSKELIPELKKTAERPHVFTF